MFLWLPYRSLPFSPSLPPSLEPKHSPHTVTPHQCCITHFKTAAPELHPRYHTECAPQLQARIQFCDACGRSWELQGAGARCHAVSVRLSVLCDAASAPSPDDGQEAVQELPDGYPGIPGPAAPDEVLDGNRQTGRLTPHHPTTPPRASQRNCDSSVSLQPWCPHA